MREFKVVYKLNGVCHMQFVDESVLINFLEKLLNKQKKIEVVYFERER